jgi:uncharacterized membrane protein YcjF (UPF0283 family)
MDANHTLSLVLHVVAALIVLAWIRLVVREMRRLK